MLNGDGIHCVCIESPLRGNLERNVFYADCAQADSLARGESPFLGHLQFTRVLDDDDLGSRRLGIAAHRAWLRKADIVAVYTDLGITDGMNEAIKLAQHLLLPVDYRSLGARWDRARLCDTGTAAFFRFGRRR